MIWTALPSLLGVHILGMASSGPDLFLVLYLATKSRKHVIAAVMGISTGVAIWITLTIFGLAAIIIASPLLMGVIQLVGGCYLIYMGISMAKVGINTLRELRAGAAPALGSEAPRSPKATLRQGLFTNMSNPRTVLFLTVVLLQFIPVGASVGTPVLCTLVLITSQIAFFLFIVIVVSTDAVVKRMVLTGPWIDTAAGVISLIFGVPLVASGVEAAP